MLPLIKRFLCEFCLVFNIHDVVETVLNIELIIKNKKFQVYGNKLRKCAVGSELKLTDKWILL